MTQKQLIIEYCKRNGKIVPATLKDSQRSLLGGWIGITAIRRCEEMALEGKIYLWPKEGRFAVYGLTPYKQFDLEKWNAQFYKPAVAEATSQKLF